jgi:hypothetical protein
MALSQENRKQFIQDYKSGSFKTPQLVKKYKFKHAQEFYQVVCDLRKSNLLPVSSLSESKKKAWETRKANKANMIKTTDSVTTEVTNKPVTDYRTVYFKDFSVQIHKKAMARLVVDHNNNLHILNN